MGASVQIDIDDASFVERFRVRFEKRLPDARRQLTRQIGRHLLHSTIRFNPVDTARSRAGWVASLNRLGWAPPAGWRGPHPRPRAIGEGIGRSHFSLTHNKDTTTIEATNEVDYVAYLEYGTRHMPPFAMVRKSLLHVGRGIGTRIRLLDFLK